ncbi:sulfatase family protein [Rubritalea marina]|uniref:sulfatase family protein n=1 Tax=Rubritalea marina TaxID=361055 RepID=UPI001969B8CA|nr:arylsulfatase [Rubritalea marina]
MAASLAAKTPNVLIIYADDLGYGDLGCYNEDSKIPTPHLDKLAAGGMRFTDGHSSSGICTPSRYALLTGRHHWRDFHDIVGAMGASVFKPERLTMPEMFQAKGYTTAAVGKWHLGWDWKSIRKPGVKELTKQEQRKKGHHFSSYDWSKNIPDGPLAHGFDYYFGDTVINFPPYTWIENDRVTEVPDTMLDTKTFKPIKEGNWECRKGPMVTGWDPYENIPVTTQKAIAWMEEQTTQEKPFFLYFAFPSPHAPIIPNDAFDGKSEAGPYGDFVVETDDSVGKLLATLDRLKITDDTIVIFSADNGPESYAYKRDEKLGHWSAYPLRGLKRDIYEGGHRVPFIIRYPGVTPAGSVSDSLVSQIDLMATLAKVIDFQLPNHNAAEDSYDQSAVLSDPNQIIRTEHVHNTFDRAFAMRQGDWVLIESQSGYHSKCPPTWEAKRSYPKDDEQAIELYNLKKDLSQMQNIASEHPEKVEQLQKRLKRIREQGFSAPRLNQ